MLSDPTQNEAFRNSKHWKSPLLNFQLRVKQDALSSSLSGDPANRPAYRSNSFSGNERNRLLLAGSPSKSNPNSRRFVDHSLVSGVDCREDSRSFALLDYDSDGWLDIALASANAPRFRLFRNRMGELGEKGRVLHVNLEGGSQTATATESSNRDACGALIVAVSSSGERRIYRRSMGEGLSSQNSGTIRITFTVMDPIQNLEVRWPSGRISNHPVQKSAENAKLVLVEPRS